MRGKDAAPHAYARAGAPGERMRMRLSPTTPTASQEGRPLFCPTLAGPLSAPVVWEPAS
jgi:hypothetical protein